MQDDLLQRLGSHIPSIREAAMEEARRLLPMQLLYLADLAEDSRHHIGLMRQMRSYVTALVSGNLADWEIGTSLTPAVQAIAQIIESREDPPFLGVALTLLQQGRYSVFIAKSAQEALKRLLPRMTAAQASRLTDLQAKTLLARLESPYLDLELTLNILQALEKFGDEGAIPVIEELAFSGVYLRRERTGFTYSSSIVNRKIGLINATPEKMRQVMLAARECLQALRQRAEETKQAQTLLRASDASTLATSETLLRSVTAAPDNIPPEQLLHPSAPPEKQKG